MTNDFSPINTPESDGPMFAPIPTWERGKKRRSFGSRGERAAPEPRSFAPLETPSTTLSGDARAYEARMDTVDPTDTSFATAPVYADRTARKGNGAAPIAIAAGVILLGGLAAAGWYAYQPHNAGVAELTPGQTTTTTQVASTVPAAGDQQVAQNTASDTAPAAPAAAAKVTTTTTTHSKAPVRTTVTRTASRSASAADRAADASTTAPVQAAPTPAAPAAAAPPAQLKLDIPPAQAAPTATAPAAEAPAPTQTAPAPAPTQTPPS
jgi:hypothetical protein